jgi:hypothetical protein
LGRPSLQFSIRGLRESERAAVWRSLCLSGEHSGQSRGGGQDHVPNSGRVFPGRRQHITSPLQRSDLRLQGAHLVPLGIHGPAHSRSPPSVPLPAPGCQCLPGRAARRFKPRARSRRSPFQRLGGEVARVKRVHAQVQTTVEVLDSLMYICTLPRLSLNNPKSFED